MNTIACDKKVVGVFVRFRAPLNKENALWRATRLTAEWL
jgi:hypothetical protein